MGHKASGYFLLRLYGPELELLLRCCHGGPLHYGLVGDEAILRGASRNSQQQLAPFGVVETRVNKMRSNSSRKVLRQVLVATLFVAAAASSWAGLDVSITIAPPVLPVYTQPMIPGDGYIWTPGYWGYGPEGYFWVPGTWVLPPRAGFLWTPGYWGFAGGFYGWHAGYWGAHVGFYGGVNYGFGYGGVGFGGGRWEGGHFAYNTAVANVNTTVIHNTYVDKTVVVNNTTVNRTSFNGPNGVNAQPSAQERSAMNEQHVAPTGVQSLHEQSARTDRAQLASVNRGRPANAAVSRPIVTGAAPSHPTPTGAASGHPQSQQQSQQPQPQFKAQAKPQPPPQAKPQPQPKPKPAAKPAEHPEEKH